MELYIMSNAIYVNCINMQFIWREIPVHVVAIFLTTNAIKLFFARPIICDVSMLIKTKVITIHGKAHPKLHIHAAQIAMP